jgi:Transglycosylase
MRRLGRILFAFLLRALAVGVLLALAAFATVYAASSALPDLGSPTAIEGLLRQHVEAARTLQSHRTVQLASPFEVNDELFVAPAGKAMLEAAGCPGLNGAEPEAKGDFRVRLLARWLGRPPAPGPGRCELELAEALVRTMGLEASRSQRLLAASRVRESISHHLLLAYWGSSYPFSPSGPFGLDEASQRLFGKPAAKLDWNEAAVLALAPDQFEEVETCRNPPKLRAMRDPFLDRLATQYPQDAKAILAQQAAPLPCSRPPPPTGFTKGKANTE